MKTKLTMLRQMYVRSQRIGVVMVKNDVLFVKLFLFYFLCSICFLYLFDDDYWEGLLVFQSYKNTLIEWVPALSAAREHVFFFNGIVVVSVFMFFSSNIFLFFYLIFFDRQVVVSEGFRKDFTAIIIFFTVVFVFNFVLIWGVLINDVGSVGRGVSKSEKLFSSMRKSELSFSVVSSLHCVGINIFLLRVVILKLVALSKSIKGERCV